MEKTYSELEGPIGPAPHSYLSSVLLGIGIVLFGGLFYEEHQDDKKMENFPSSRLIQKVEDGNEITNDNQIKTVPIEGLINENQ